MEQNKEKQSQSKSKGKKQTRQTREQRRQLEMILVGILILIVIIVIAVLVIHRRTYHNYSVLSSSKNENVQAYGFVQFEDEILKYGTDGVSLVNQNIPNIALDGIFGSETKKAVMVRGFSDDKSDSRRL